MYIALSRRAAPWIARAIPAALLAFAAIALLLSSRLLTWLSTSSALVVVSAVILATVARQRSPETSASTTAFLGS